MRRVPCGARGVRGALGGEVTPTAHEPVGFEVNIGSDTYQLRRRALFTQVERQGDAPFSCTYEDPAEALDFFAACVGMSYLRTLFPDIQERFK